MSKKDGSVSIFIVTYSNFCLILKKSFNEIVVRLKERFFGRLVAVVTAAFCYSHIH